MRGRRSVSDPSRAAAEEPPANCTWRTWLRLPATLSDWAPLRPELRPDCDHALEPSREPIRQPFHSGENLARITRHQLGRTRRAETDVQDQSPPRCRARRLLSF